MKLAIVIAAALISVSACAREDAADGDTGEAPISGHGSIDAPIPEDVGVRITGADKGGDVDVRVGEKVAVALVGIPTAGYIWIVRESPAFLEPAGETSGPTSTAQLEPGFAGGNHWEVFFFTVTGEGSGVLRLEQRRPWEEDTEPANDEFSVTLTAIAG